MIQITAYLRDEHDLAIWRAIQNKSRFLHDALTKLDTTEPTEPTELTELKETAATKPAPVIPGETQTQRSARLQREERNRRMGIKE